MKSFPKNGFLLISVKVSILEKKNQVRESGFHKTKNSFALYGIKKLFKSTFKIPLDEK